VIAAQARTIEGREEKRRREGEERLRKRKAVTKTRIKTPRQNF